MMTLRSYLFGWAAMRNILIQGFFVFTNNLSMEAFHLKGRMDGNRSIFYRIE